MTRSLQLALLFSVLTFVMALPFSLHPGSRLLVDAPDTHLFLWTLAWEAHALVSQPLAMFDGNFYYPYDNTLAWSENIIGSGLIAAPIIWLTGNVVLALNLVALLSHVLCGLGTWLLARQLGVGPYGATVSGIIFAFSPARFFRMSQHHLTTVQWMPFSLAFVYAYLEHGRPRDLRLAILFFTLQALTSGHGAVFLTLAILVLLIYRAALGEQLAPLRRLRDMGVTGALLFAPVGWIWWHYRRAQTEVGLVRELFPNDWFPALQSFAASPSHFHIALQRLITGQVLNDRADSFLFPGLVPIVLALAAFIPVLGSPAERGSWRARWRRSAVGFCIVLTLASLWIFLRPPFGVWPYLYWLPVLNQIRMPSRFMIVTLLALSVLAGIGFERAFARLRSTQWLAATIIAAILLLAEFSAHPFAGVPYAVDVPAIDRWLDTQPKPFVVAEVPVPRENQTGPFERFQVNSLLHSTAHWQKTVMGFTSIRPAVHKRLYELMPGFPDDASLAALRDIGVTMVIMHTDLYRSRDLAEVERRLAAHADDLRLVHTEGAGRAYALLPGQ
jgi:hypothetical protein